MKEVVFESLYEIPSRNGVTKPRGIRGNGYKMINMGELFAYGRINNPDMDLVPLTLKELENFQVKEGDLLFARQSLIASGAGKCSIVIKCPEITVFESHIIRVRLNKEKCNPLFYYYYFSSPIGIEKTQSLVSQVAAAGIRGSELSKLMVHYFEKEKQDKIAKILSNYDDLIENNNKRIKILEEMSQKIYKEWFVDFKYPGHETATFKDTELGKIPSDWKVESIGNLISNIESGSRPKGGINPLEKDIPSIGAENILGLGKYEYTKEKYISYDFFSKMKKGKVQNLDVLLYKDGAQLGRKTIFGENFPHSVCCVNEHVFILRTNEHISPYYLYFTLDTKENTEKIKQLNTNAAQPGINQEQIKGLKIIQPRKDVINSFDKIITPIVSQIFKLCIKNKNLKQTRDILLPRLVSGEINVDELEIQ